MITPSVPVQIPFTETFSKPTTATYQTGLTSYSQYTFKYSGVCYVQWEVCPTAITYTCYACYQPNTIIVTSTYVQTNSTYSVLVISPFAANVNGSTVLMLSIVSASAILIFLSRPKTVKPDLDQPLMQTTVLTQPPTVELSRTASSISKFCRECGAEIPRDSVFCEECGTKLATETVSSIPTTEVSGQFMMPRSRLLIPRWATTLVIIFVVTISALTALAYMPVGVSVTQTTTKASVSYSEYFMNNPPQIYIRYFTVVTCVNGDALYCLPICGPFGCYGGGYATMVVSSLVTQSAYTVHQSATISYTQTQTMTSATIVPAYVALRLESIPSYMYLVLAALIGGVFLFIWERRTRPVQ